jgi:hypothetical protein
MAPHLRMSAMSRMPCLGASACWKRLCRFCRVRARIFARRHVILANGREAFADREHTGEIDSSRRWASREADRPSWPGRVSKVAKIGSSRSLPSLAAQTLANSRGRVPEGYGRLKYGLANGSIGRRYGGAPGGGKWAGSKSH